MSDSAQQWWRKPFGMFQTNLREINADMDVEKTLDFIQALGADAWLIGVGGILSYYPSDLPFQTRNPYLSKRPSGDLIGDAIKATHARGMKLLARMDFSKTSKKIAAEHPDWCFLSPENKLQTHTGDLVSVCPSGPYYQEKVFEILTELMTRYPVDGFFFNWMSFNEVDYNKVYQGVCHCANCQRQYKATTGRDELPTGPTSPDYIVWSAFAAGVINKLTARIRAHIAAHLPNAGLILGTTADIMFHEANNALGRELWHHATTEWVSASRAYRPNVPVLVNCVTFMDMPYRMASEEPAHFGQYLVQTISRGGSISTYIMGAPGQIPYLVFDIAGQITRFHQRFRDVYDGLTPCAKTGLVRPDRLQQTTALHPQSVKEFRGLYLSLQQKHVPFDVVAQEHIPGMLENGGLSRYSVLILPDLGPLSEATVTALDQFVGKGGRILSTGSSGVSADKVQLQSSPAQKPTTKILEGKQLWSSYVAPPMEASGDPNVYFGPTIPLYGAYHFFDWKTGVKPHLAMLGSAPFAPPEKAYGNVQTSDPGYVLGSYGQGQAAVIPWTIGRAYHDLGLTVLRDMFHDVVSTLLGEDVYALEADLPEQVELTINTSGSDTVVHLINMSGARTTNFGPPVPVRGGTLRVKQSGSGLRARALVSGKTLELERSESGAVTIVLPEFELFEVVVIKTS